MTQLGEGLFASPTPVVVEPPQEDLLGLRLEMVLAALEGLRESLTELPTPQVFIDAPDLSAVVNAVNGLKPGADADEIAQAVVRTLAPTAAPAETGEWQTRLISALEKLDFRLKGVTGQGTSNANLPALLTSAPGSDTGQAALPVRVISQLGAGGGGGGGGAATIADGADVAQGATTDVEAAAGNGTVIALLKRIRTLLSGTLSTARTWTLGSGTDSVSVGNFPATQAVSAATLPLPAGAAQDGTDISAPTAMPAGGAGIRGWLSAIWTKLNGSIAVTGTFWQATQPVSLATNTPDVTDRAARLLGHVTVDNASIPVTGTFWQATQPVSLAATVATKEIRSSTSAVTTASITTTTAAVLASNASRLGATVYNESGAILYLHLGATASLTAYTLQVAIGGYYEVPFGYTGALSGITTAGTAVCRVVEVT